MSKSIVIAHIADLDGLASAAICKYFLPNAEIHLFDYGDKIPWDKIDIRTDVYMVDISVPLDDMLCIKNVAKSLVWCDHHKSAIDMMKDNKFDGIQRDGTAAASLTWEYFSYYKIPLGVKLLSNYDVFNLENPDTIAYQYGIMALNLNPNNTEDWIYNVFRDEVIPYHIKQGKTILNYLGIVNKKECNSLAFETTLNGHSVLAVNRAYCGSLFFKDHPLYDEVDILCTFFMRQDHTWNISLYTTKDDVDCSEICKLYGGGGHKAAAGFQVIELIGELKHGNNNI
jgi:oligoribonuclease NrnB/cAMP/cGMP phosphodiesterase (DHH superfamily)